MRIPTKIEKSKIWWFFNKQVNQQIEENEK